jgi:hypothetical protein
VAEGSTLTVVLRAVTGEFTAAMGQATTAVQEFGKSSGALSGPLGRMFGLLGGAGVLLGAAAGIGMIAKAEAQGAEEASKFDAMLRIMANSAKSVGEAFDISKAREFLEGLATSAAGAGLPIEELYKSYQRLNTVIHDQAEAQTVMRDALDISARTGRDYNTVVMALVKAHEGNATALRRLGIDITTAQLKTMTFAQVVNKLEHESRGAAETLGNTLGGQVGILHNKMSLLWEHIGRQLEPTFRDLVSLANTYLVPALDFIAKGVEALIISFDQLVHIIIDAGGIMEHAFAAMGDALAGHFGAAKDQINALKDAARDFGHNFVALFSPGSVGAGPAEPSTAPGLPGDTSDITDAGAGPTTKTHVAKEHKERIDLSGGIKQQYNVTLSLTQQLRTLQDQAAASGNMFLYLNDGAIKPLHAAMLQAIAVVDKITPKWTALLDDMHEAMLNALHSLTRELSGAVSGENVSAYMLQQSGDFFNKFANVLERMTSPLGGTELEAESQAAQYGKTIAEGIVKAFQENDPVKAIMDIIDAFLKLIMETKGFQDIIRTISVLIGTVLAPVIRMISVLFEIIAKFLQMAITVLEPFIKLWVNIFTDVAQVVIFFYNALATVIDTLFGWLGIHLDKISMQFDMLAQSTARLIEVFNNIPTLNQLGAMGGPSPGVGQQVASSVRANQATRSWAIGTAALGGSW